MKVGLGLGQINQPQIWQFHQSLKIDDKLPSMSIEFNNKRQSTNSKKVQFSDIWTFTSGGGGTYYDSEGYRKVAAANELRYDTDPVTKQSNGALLECLSRTNYVAMSRTLDWTGSGDGVSTTVNDGYGTWGEQTALSVTLLSTGEVCWLGGVLNGFTNNGSPFSQSIDIKRIGIHTKNRYFLIKVRSSDWSQQAGVVIDLQNNTVTAKTNGGATIGNVMIEQLVDGYYRIHAENCIISSGYATLSIENGFCNSVGDILGGGSGFGDDASGCYLENHQLELGKSSTSYIPTLSSNVTIARDSLNSTGSKFSDWYNQSEGTIVIKHKVNNPKLNNMRVFDINEGASISRMINYLETNNNEVMFSSASISVLGVSQGAIRVNGNIIDQNMVSIISYKENDIIHINSLGQAIDNTALIPTVNRLDIYNSFTGDGLAGVVESISYYPFRATNAELQRIV